MEERQIAKQILFFLFLKLYNLLRIACNRIKLYIF